MKDLSESEIGYLAGFLDGEGSFIINKRMHQGYQRKDYIGYSAYIDLGSTNKQVLSWIKELIEVSSNIYENQQKGNRKLAYRIRISYKQAKPLTEKVFEHLIIKKECAKIFLQYGETDEKEKLFQTMKKLNHRGL